MKIKKIVVNIFSGFAGAIILLIGQFILKGNKNNLEENINSGQQSFVEKAENFTMNNESGIPPEMYREVSEQLGEQKYENKYLREQLYFKERHNIDVFLKEIESTTKNQREKFEENSKRSIKETAIKLLQPKGNTEKISIQGKIFKKAIEGKINYEEAIKFSEMVNKVYLGELKEFIKNKNLRITDNNSSLVFAGIFEPKSGNGLRRPRSLGAPIRYVLTSDGKQLYYIIKDL